MPPTMIAPLDLAELREAFLRRDLEAARAELARARLFVHYGLGVDDTFDMQTGQIMRAAHASDFLPPEPRA